MKYCLIILLGVALTGNTFAQTADDYSKTTDYKKFIERIAGQWTLQQIVDAEKRDVSNNANRKKAARANDVETDQGNNAMQKIEFYDNARYRMNNATQAIDSGSYRLNEQHGILYLQSDLGDTEPSEWKIELDNRRLTLTGRGGDAASRYRYVYNKSRSNVVR